VLSACLVLSACSPEAYRRSADRQVEELLDDRQKQTLDYAPQVEAPGAAPATVPKGAYERIPASPIPPPTAAPLTAAEVRFTAEPLGPQGDPPPLMGAELEDFVQQLSLRRSRQIGAAFGPPAPGQTSRRLDLFGCIAYAVQHSRTYQDQMELLYLAALDTTLERHLFSPRPFARSGVSFSGGQGSVEYRSAYTAANSIGVRQQLPYGGEVVAQALVDFVQALNGNASEGESASLVVSGSIPLLRGFGLVNLEPLISSERDLVYQVRAFEEFRRSFVVEIASRYFSLLATQQGVVNRRLSVATFEKLTERAREMYAAGRLGRQGFLEVQRSLQSWLSAEASLINAEESYRSALDEFKITLGMPVDEPLELAPVRMDVNVPTLTADEAVALAHRYRLSLKTAEDRVEDAQRSVKHSQNNLLPDLNLTADARMGNEAGEPAAELEDRTLTYRAGITLDWPIDRVAQRNSYRRSLISLHRTQRTLTALRDRITADVRDALRAIRAAELEVEIQLRGIDLAQRRVEFSNELLKQGLINARDPVEAQNSLLDAQDRYERARSQLQVRVLEFMRDTGTLRVDPSAGVLGQVMDRTTRQRAAE
jgi:outer membrane protein TolC